MMTFLDVLTDFRIGSSPVFLINITQSDRVGLSSLGSFERGNESRNQKPQSQYSLQADISCCFLYVLVAYTKEYGF